MNSIPIHFIKLHFDYGNEIKMFNVPIKDLNKTELISCIGYLNKKIDSQRKNHPKDIQTLLSLKRKPKKEKLFIRVIGILSLLTITGLMNNLIQRINAPWEISGILWVIVIMISIIIICVKE